MQDILQEILSEIIKVEQFVKVDLWEFDLIVIGGECFFFCNELNEKGELLIWQGRQYELYLIQVQDFEMNGKGVFFCLNFVVVNFFGLVMGMVEDL